MYKTEIEVKISTKLQYVREGETFVADTLILRAPSAKNMAIISQVKQELIKALKKQSEENKKNNLSTATVEEVEDTSDTKAQGFIMFLYSCDSIDMGKFSELFKKLFISGTCLVPPVTSKYTLFLHEGLYDLLSWQDVEQLMGEYIINFLLSSF